MGTLWKRLLYSVKLNITTDLKKQLLAVRFATARSDDRETFYTMNHRLDGVFVADAGYIYQMTCKHHSTTQGL